MSMEDFMGYARGASSRFELEDSVEIVSNIGLLYGRVQDIIEEKGRIEKGDTLTRIQQWLSGGKTHEARLFYEFRTILSEKNGKLYPATVKLKTDFSLMSGSEKPVIETGDDLMIDVIPDSTRDEEIRSLFFTLGRNDDGWRGGLEFEDEYGFAELDLGDCKILNLLLDSI